MNQTRIPTLSSKSHGFIRWNDEMAGKFDPDAYHRRSFFLIRWIEWIRGGIIARLLSPGESDLVLDLGCGAGNLIGRLSRGRCVGVDLSPALLRKARCGSYGVPVSFLRSFAEKLPLRSGSVDRVFCSEVLEHVPDPGEVLAEVRRVLAPKGIFVVSVPNETFIDSVKDLLQATGLARIVQACSGYTFEKRMDEEWHLHHFDLNLLRRYLAPHFKITKTKLVVCPQFPVRIIAACTAKGGGAG